MANLDRLWKESLSGCPKGEAKPIAGTAWNSVTELHDITDANAIDAVFLRFWNTTAAEVSVSLVLNPDDQATQSSVDASTIVVLVPPRAAGIPVLAGDIFRRQSGSPSYTVAAYVAGGDASKVLFTGHFTRAVQDALTP